MTTKQAIFRAHLAEWLKAKGDRKKRGKMIKDISQIAQVHPQSVGRCFYRVQMVGGSAGHRRGRRAYYTGDVRAALYDIWSAANQPCGELLHPVVGEYIAAFKKEKRWKHTREATDKLRSMSVATMKRICVSLRDKYGIGHGRSSTKPSALKAIIPIFKGPWSDLPPGHGQIDTVAHCGESLLGDYAYTVSFVDVSTYWGIRRAQWNKGQEGTKQSLVSIKGQLPFLWLSAHPDTGSEFINWLNKAWCDENNITLTRSEPGKKNDNMYVEERNGHVVRKYLGWLRLDAGREIVPLMNAYYTTLDRYLNHFHAVRRTVEKERIGARYRRTFEREAKTPYQRLMAHASTTQATRQALAAEHNSLNPLLLKERLDMLRKKIMKFQNMRPQ